MEDFTEYDVKPKEFINYLRYYGQHFNKKLCEFACSRLSYNSYTKEKLDQLCQVHKINIPNQELYDIVYVANWCRSIFYGSSIEDEKHLLLFIKDIFDKESKLLFNRWYADKAKSGIPIDWDEMV